MSSTQVQATSGQGLGKKERETIRYPAEAARRGEGRGRRGHEEGNDLRHSLVATSSRALARARAR